MLLQRGSLSEGPEGPAEEVRCFAVFDCAWHIILLLLSEDAHAEGECGLLHSSLKALLAYAAGSLP